MKAPSPANQCATRTSSRRESPASMPAGASAPAERRVSFGDAPAAGNGSLGNSAYKGTDNICPGSLAEQWQGRATRTCYEAMLPRQPLRFLLADDPARIRRHEDVRGRARGGRGRWCPAASGNRVARLREAVARQRRLARQPRAARARGDGAGRGAPPAAALHRIVLPRGVPAARRLGPPT